MKIKFYSLKAILERDAQYNIIIGERSNGKTYSVLKYGLEKYENSGEQIGIVRRWQEDFKGKRGANLFTALVENGVVNRVTKGKWDNIIYYSGRWYLSKFDISLKKDIMDEKPLAYSFSIGSAEHEKSVSYPDITTILFDEFLTRGMYLPDEFVSFMSIVSTIIRYRKNVKIFMLGNTVNKYSPYFSEMGLTNIQKMKQGNIDVYTYGNSELKVAVEYADTPNRGKPSDFYFAFDNPKLNMITSGAWELAIYPHCPIKYSQKNILFTYFISFERDLLQCEIVQKDDLIFTFIHKKTSPLKDEENDLIYRQEYSPRQNIKRKITKPTTPIEKRIAAFFVKDKVFYQDNETGEIVRNYLAWCNSDKIK